MVVLEFAQTINMDAVTIEKWESLNQIKGYWDDSSLIIMKMNPDMLPVTAAAAECSEICEGSEPDYVKQYGASELEKY